MRMGRTGRRRQTSTGKRRQAETTPAEPQTLPKRSGFRKAWVLFLLLIVVAGWVAATHAPALTAKASSFDDEQYLEKNKLVQNPSWNSAWRFLSEVLEPSTVRGYYQPLAMISLMLDYAIAGRTDNLVPFHVTSLALHVLNVCLVAVLMYLLFGNVWAAAVAALLFGVHPMTVEPIPWVSERKTLLASFFALWSIILYVRYARRQRRTLLVLALVAYLLAVMSKPTTTVVPLLLLLMDFWPLKRLGKRAFIEKIPFVVVMVVFGIITVISQARTAVVVMPGEYSPARIPLIVCHNIIFYLHKILWPVRLSSHYAMPKHLAVGSPMVLAGVIGTCILVPVLLVSLKWTRSVFTAWSFFFVGILPTMQIIGFTNVIASDKYAYLPGVGLVMLLAFVLGRMFRAFQDSPARIAAVVAVALMVGVAESTACRRYLVRWQDSERLYRYMLALAPEAPSLHLNLGNILLKTERFDEALAHYKKAVAVAPRYTHAHLNLGIALSAAGKYAEAAEQFQIVLRQKKNDKEAMTRMAYALDRAGRGEQALEWYDRALRLWPEDAKLLNNYALALAGRGRPEKAVELFKRAVELNGNSVEVLNNLGNAYLQLRQVPQAIECYRKVLALQEDFVQAHYNLANALRQSRQFDEAIKHYERALQLDSGDADAHYGMALALVEQKKVDSAIMHLKKAVALNSNFARAYYQLGLIYHGRNDIDAAIEQFRHVLRIHPDDAEMHCNLGSLLAEKGQLQAAIEQFRTALRLDPHLDRARRQLESALARQAGKTPPRQ